MNNMHQDNNAKCLCCRAERLSVSCGCRFEAKQHEYAMSSSIHKGHVMHHHDHEAAMASPEMAAFMEYDMKRRFFISLILTVPLALLAHIPYLHSIFSPTFNTWLGLILSTPIVFFTGSIFITGAYYSLKKRQLNMSVLIATGVLSAYFGSFLMLFLGQHTFFEAAGMLVTFVLFGHWMEMKSRRGTSDALRALFDLVPPHAMIIRGDKEVRVNVSEISVGDIVIVRSGERIPIDGIITKGQSTVDESLVTGESTPLLKSVHDTVTGGSILQEGSVQFKVTKAVGETVLAQIIKLVEEAQHSKAPGQRLADTAAAYLVIIAIGAGISTFFIWFLGAHESLPVALSFAISAVVVACPDALGLATPTAVAVATGLGAQHNILIKNAVALELVSKITTIVLDKTGTLTQGNPTVTDIITVPGFTEHDVAHYGGSLQANSGHSFAKAILQKIKNLSFLISQEVTNFESVAGIGLKGIVDGKTVVTGSMQMLAASGVDISPLKKDIDRLIPEGKSVTVVAVDGKAIGAFFLVDALRDNSKQTVDALKELGIEPIMLTGDSPIIARQVSQKLGIDTYFAQVLPADKQRYIKQLQDQGKFVAMVGDGINDAPALAQANIGIAIGSGTDVAIASASIILMKSDPADIVRVIKLSKATVRKMKQNLFWASIYNVIAIPLAAGIFYTSFGWSLNPAFSALLMSLSSVIVATNAVLLKRIRLD